MLKGREGETYQTLTHRQMQSMAFEHFLKKGNRWDGLQAHDEKNNPKILIVNTHPSLTYPQRFCTPFLMYGTFERYKPSVIKLTYPPIC
jgi:hypothetical protein